MKGMENVDVVKTADIHEIDPVYFIGPIVVGLLILVLLVLIACIIKKHVVLMTFLGVMITFLSIGVSWILITEKPKVIGKEITVVIEDKKTLKSLSKKYEKIEKVDKDTYVIYIEKRSEG